jgi:predicted Zn-dependent protease
MQDLMLMLARLSSESGSGKVPGYLQTHPDPEERLQNVKQRIADAKHDFSGAKVDRASYLGLIDNLVYGEDPRQGFFKGSLFQHPGLKFQMTFPEGWKTQNQPQAVIAVSPQQDAIMQLQAAPKMTPEQAAQQFFSQQGIQRGETMQGSSNGLQSIVSTFTAQTQQGAVAGIVTFLAHSGQTWAILAYAQTLSEYRPSFEKSMASFGPLTDPAALAVQPSRLKLVKVEQEMTLEEFNRRHPSNAPLEKIALINGLGLENSSRLKPGQLAKIVVGGPPYEPKAKAQ